MYEIGCFRKRNSINVNIKYLLGWGLVTKPDLDFSLRDDLTDTMGYVFPKSDVAFKVPPAIYLGGYSIRELNVDPAIIV